MLNVYNKIKKCKRNLQLKRKEEKDQSWQGASQG